MILDLTKNWSVNTSRSILVGDKQSDLDAARTANIRALRYEDGNVRDKIVAELNRLD
jgi:D-glycero-D-manno-heptose 1,7-bisphosphate phosphatase